MLSSIRFEVNEKAVGQILKSDEVRDWVLGAAEAGADSAGDGFEARVLYGHDRVSAIVKPVTAEARRAVAADSTVLTRALGAVRG